MADGYACHWPFSFVNRGWLLRAGVLAISHAQVSQLSAGVVLDENATLESLQKFPVVFLSNVGVLTDQEIGLVRDYVKQGGKLLITGQTGQFDAMGEPLPVAPITELVGADVAQCLATEDDWVSVDASTRRRDFATPQICQHTLDGTAKSPELLREESSHRL